MARLARLLVASSEEGGLHSSNVDGIIEGLGRHERVELVGQLEHQHADTPLLLRALLRLPPLRLDTARTALRLIQSERVAGKTAFLCLSELRIALVRYWERGEAPPDGLERDAQKARLEELLDLCGELLGGVIDEGALTVAGIRVRSAPPARTGGAGWVGGSDADDGRATCTSRRWGEGHALAVQLLPALLRAADAVHMVLPASHSACSNVPPSERVISRLLEGQWGAETLQPVLAAIEDIALTRSQVRVWGLGVGGMEGGGSWAGWDRASYGWIDVWAEG